MWVSAMNEILLEPFCEVEICIACMVNGWKLLVLVRATRWGVQASAEALCLSTIPRPAMVKKTHVYD
jgi:hypothetical protein